ncbi:MAG: hypothetical protein PXX73_07245 [Sideroxydans sp.]|nr:hypothetical protein [Sideroxydans sp.]
MNETILTAERQHLANLLEAIQRCAYFLHASEQKINWPLTATQLAQRKKDPQLFESLAAINERFAKLQDTLGAAMRHSAMLMSEPTDSFLKVLSFFEKNGVISSVSAWQLCRAARNLAAHDYEVDYAAIAEHFNTLHDLQGMLYQTSVRLLAHTLENLAVAPASSDFTQEFTRIAA